MGKPNVWPRLLNGCNGGTKMKKQRGLAIATFVVVLGAAFLPSKLWPKIHSPRSMADEQELAQECTVIFRGKVLQVNADPHPVVREWGTINGVEQKYNFLAKFQVDRVYRGKVAATFDVPFATGGRMMGYDCIDFEPDQYWVIFWGPLAAGGMILADDCNGALRISPRLGPTIIGADWSSQMEADLTAGLDDPDPEARIWSLQRLGGLKLASSQPALRGFMGEAQSEEKKWAVYAALRTGDMSVLPQVRDYLSATTERGSPEASMAFELREMANPDAIPELIKIGEETPSSLTRHQALVAFLWHFRDLRTVPAFAANLGAEDRDLRSIALAGMVNFAGTSACADPTVRQDNSTAATREAFEQDFTRHVEFCKAWWDNTGSKQDWIKN